MFVTNGLNCDIIGASSAEAAAKGGVTLAGLNMGGISLAPSGATNAHLQDLVSSSHSLA